MSAAGMRERFGPIVEAITPSATRWVNLQVLVLYGLIALGLLGPMASNEFLPSAPDHVNHTRIIVQAKMAIHERQFPLRVAPDEFYGCRYPLFQFYSPLVYTVGGGLYKWIITSNPIIVYKTLYWFSLVLGGFFIHRLVHWLMGSRGIALVTGAMYMVSPYFLINIHARGALTEAVAQGIIPGVVYASLRCYQRGTLGRALAVSLWWAALILTHNISFVYTSLFVALLLIGLSLPRLARGKTWRRLGWSGAAYAGGLLLTAYFLVPIAYAREYLPVSVCLRNPVRVNWLTPIATLLSPTSVPFEPIVASRRATPFLHSSLGWPALAGVAICVYGLLRRDSLLRRRYRALTVTLLACFLLSFFVTWSPVDFWFMLPRQLWICQFSYRLLAQCAWIAALLFGIALKSLWGSRFDVRHVVLGVVLVVVCNASYLPTLKAARETLPQIIATPDMGYGRGGYLPYGDQPSIVRHTIEPDKVIDFKTIREHFIQQRTVTHGEMSIEEEEGAYVQLPAIFFPDMLDVRVDGSPASCFAYRGMATVKLPQGDHTIDVCFVGIRWANWVCAAAWLVVLGLATYILASRFHPGRFAVPFAGDSLR